MARPSRRLQRNPSFCTAPWLQCTWRTPGLSLLDRAETQAKAPGCGQAQLLLLLLGAWQTEHFVVVHSVQRSACVVDRKLIHSSCSVQMDVSFFSGREAAMESDSSNRPRSRSRDASSQISDPADSDLRTVTEESMLRLSQDQLTWSRDFFVRVYFGKCNV